MTQDDKPNRKDTVSWLETQADRLMMDPDVLAAMPREDVYEELEETAADLKPAIDAIRKRLDQSQPRLMVIRWMAAAAIVLLVLYGGLLLAGRSTRPPTYALAALSDHHRQALSEAIRSHINPENPEQPSDFVRGTEALLAAPQSELMPFARYDKEQVERAITHLKRSFDAAEDPFLRAQIAFFLAKAHLMREDVTAAREALNQVLDQNTALYREEVQALLQRLDTL